MSLILKGIDMPQMGETKRIVLYDNGDIVVNEEGWDEDGCRCYKTSYDVQAIQIPKGHGRLIDADKLADDLQADGEEFGEDLKLNCASWLRSDANATILAEE